MEEVLMVSAFNSWMKEYTEQPEKFEREWETVSEFLKEQSNGEELSYGAHCAKLLQRYAEKGVSD